MHRKPCHNGQIDVLLHDRASNLIVSGGADGYVRIWDFTRINEAEAGEDSNNVEITPADELLIAPGASCVSLCVCVCVCGYVNPCPWL